MSNKPERAQGQDPLLLRRLLRAKDRMDAASHEDWPVARLASVSGVSEAHFARAFKQAFGAPPHRYLLSRRIERASALLRDSDLPILDIAFDTGWNSLGTFGRTFRDITGESPTDLRARARVRSSRGLSPVMSRKVRPKVPRLFQPVAKAISMIGNSVSRSSAEARSIRRVSR